MRTNCKSFFIIRLFFSYLACTSFLHFDNAPVPNNPAPAIEKVVEKAADKPVAQLSEEEIGINGNWVKKVNWLRQALLYKTEIDETFTKIIDLRQNEYNKKIAMFEERMGSFHQNINAKRGDLSSMTNVVATNLEKSIKRLIQQSKQIDTSGYNENIRFRAYEIEEKLNTKKEALEQIRLDLESIHELDASFQERVKVLNKYIDDAYEVKETAETYIEQIHQIINHDKAREKSYKMKNLLDKIKAIAKYTQEDALKSFESEYNTVNQESTRIEDKIKQHKNELNDLDDQIQKLSQNPNLESSQSQESTAKATLSKSPRPVAQAQSNGIFGSLIKMIWGFFTGLFSWIGSIFK